MKADDAAYPMRLVTRVTGLSADVVRAWERRYGAITPARTGGNARRYTHADVVRLGRLKAAVDQGHAISTVARLRDEALIAILSTPPPTNSQGSFDEVRRRYLDAVSRFELSAAETTLIRAAQLAPPREIVLDLIAPLLREVGDRWHEEQLSIAEEHAVTAQVRALVGTLLRTTDTPAGAPRLLVGTPPGQQHELGAMMAAVLAAQCGALPLYLGADVPWSELAQAARDSRASLLVLSMPVRVARAHERGERRSLERLAETVEVWVGAPDGHPASRAKGVRAFCDYAPFEMALTHRLPR